MGSLSNAKILGGIGAILGLVGLGFIGFILKLVAVKQISDATDNKEIFSKYLWAAILNIVAGIVLFGSFFIPLLSGNLEFSLSALGLGLIVAVILMIIGVIFMKQSYDMISEETGVGMFKTVALLYIIGAVLMIILVGSFIILIAAILEIVAFFSLPDEVPGRAQPA